MSYCRLSREKVRAYLTGESLDVGDGAGVTTINYINPKLLLATIEALDEGRRLWREAAEAQVAYRHEAYRLLRLARAHTEQMRKDGWCDE